MKYKILRRQVFLSGKYSIMPIRMEDRFNIMKWRNEQIYHLRQNKPLTEEDQDQYFNTVVKKNFETDEPDQLLFSYLDGDKCIGYGGLVHINWNNRNAEVSFIMDTQLEQYEFHKHWGIFLDLLDQIAFNELRLHKVFTYAFDLRPHLYKAIEAKGFVREAVLKEHYFFQGGFKDVIIHSKINHGLSLRLANIEDSKLFFNWANDDEVRKNSFTSERIDWDKHIVWFNIKLNNINSKLFILMYNDIPIGQLRLDKQDKYWLIDYSIDKTYRGKGFGKEMIKLLMETKLKPLKAVVRKNNSNSFRVFKKNDFFMKEEWINSESVYVFYNE